MDLVSSDEEDGPTAEAPSQASKLLGGFAVPSSSSTNLAAWSLNDILTC